MIGWAAQSELPSGARRAGTGNGGSLLQAPQSRRGHRSGMGTGARGTEVPLAPARLRLRRYGVATPYHC